MTRLLRILGFLLIVVGALIVASWLIRPLRVVWEQLHLLPTPIKVGLSAASIGFLILLGSLIWERLENRENDRSLLDDEL